jgi:hypothetical protein
MTKAFFKCYFLIVFVFLADDMVAEDLNTNVSAADAMAFAAPTELTATLVDRVNIDLKWKDNATDEAGYFVEYSPNLDDQFDIITALPPNATTYRHPHLMPKTRFRYRVIPYFGKASNIAEVTTGKQGPQQNPAPDITNAAPHSAANEIKKSVRSTLTAAGAVPTGLKATLIPPAGIKLEWKDNARDEDGYLVEIKNGKNSDFKVSAFLDSGTTSLISYGYPLETTFYFRVRPFFYGKPSNLAEKTTE